MNKKKTRYSMIEILSLIIAIGALAVSFWAVKKSDEIAKKSGAYDRGELIISFLDFDILEDKTYDVYFGVKFRPNEINFLELPYSASNIGNKTVNEIVLLNNYPNEVKAAIDSDVLEIKSILGDEVKRKSFSSKPFDQVSLSLKSLNPHSTVSLNDLMHVQETSFENQTISGVTKDGHTMHFNVSAGFSYQVITTLSATDIISQNYHLNIQNINSSDSKEILKQVIKHHQSKKGATSRRPFFIIMTEVDDVKDGNGFKLNRLKCISNSSYMYQFEEDMKYIFRYGKDKSITIIDPKNL
jgi:hypothetical protein